MSSEPPRLHTDPESELERALLGAGRSYRASSSARNRVLAGMGLAGAAASSNAAASGLGKLGAAKWVIAAAVAAGAAVPVVHYLSARHPALASPSNQRAAEAVPAGPTMAGALPAQASAEPEAAIVPSAAPTPSAIALHSEQKSAPLSAELSALDAARSSLVAGDPNTALSALDAYSRRFPHGRLSLEAEVLRIDALGKSGQTAAARQRASAFIRRHPDSVLATRVRAFAGQ